MAGQGGEGERRLQRLAESRVSENGPIPCNLQCPEGKPAICKFRPGVSQRAGPVFER